MKTTPCILALLACALLASSGCTKKSESAYAAYQRGDYATAVKLWRPLAEKGDAESQYYLGLAYQKGYFVPQDTAEALKWYGEAARQGHAMAQSKVGWSYIFGWGVAKDDAEALKWFRRSAFQNEAAGQDALGYMYQFGHGVKVDKDMAVDWYYKAGMSYLKMNDRENALRLLDDINNISPNHELGTKLRLALFLDKDLGQIP